MKLYSYWRSTTSYRVRIALALKGVAYETVPVNLVDGQQLAADYREVNPIAGVPSLVLSDGTVLTQSMAILEWLEVAYPHPPLLPPDPIKQAHIRAAALIVATDIHPVNNLKVVNTLRDMGHDEETIVAWMQDWIMRGLTAYQSLIGQDTPFSFGDTVDLADICLVAQLYNAHRWDCDMTRLPRLAEIERRCLALPAFKIAQPDQQADAR